MDENEVKGSPLILLDELERQKDNIKSSGRNISIYFNDLNKDKVEKLRKNTSNYDLPWTPKIDQLDFFDSFGKELPNMGSSPSLVFLDQNGVKMVNKSIFQKLASKGSTDILFFFASSYQKRFNELFSNDLDVPKNTPANEVHRCVAKQYRSWAPDGYYVGDYSIKKGTNIYGLIFGSGHWLGMMKFLQVVWKDEIGGDANFPMEAKLAQGSLFDGYEKTKLEILEEEIKARILSRKFMTDKDVSMYCIENGVLPSKIAKGLYSKLKRKNVISYSRGNGPRTGEDSIKRPRTLNLV